MLRKISLTEIWQKIAKTRVRKSSSADFLPSEKVETGKTSLADIIQNRTKIKIIGAFLILLMVGLGYYYIVGTRPKKGEAATVTISATGTITQTGTTSLYTRTVPATPALTIPIANADDVVISGASTVVTMSGTNHFKNLVIDGATVTHQALLSSDYYLSVLGFWRLDTPHWVKKIDIVLDGDLTISSGGKINADGKGHAGGILNGVCAHGSGAENDKAWDNSLTNKKGYGQGGGVASYSNDPDRLTVGGGGAFGGLGGLPKSNEEYYPTSDRAQAYLPDEPNILKYGSGGGASKSGDKDDCDDPHVKGGNGGGKIILNVQGKVTIPSGTSISAVGSNSTKYAGEDTYGGAGSGGWVEIAANNFVSFGTTININGGTGNDSQGTGALINQSGTTVYNISVKGGDGYTTYGGGGGGRVTLILVKPPTSVQKTLEPKKRNGANDTNFNPYNLQKDDRVGVKINISNNAVGGTFSIKDEMLRTKYLTPNFYCRPDVTTFSPVAPTGTGTEADPFIWAGLTSATTEISYECEVKE